jgi:hypothetical protein
MEAVRDVVGFGRSAIGLTERGVVTGSGSDHKLSIDSARISNLVSHYTSDIRESCLDLNMVILYVALSLTPKHTYIKASIRKRVRARRDLNPQPEVLGTPAQSVELRARLNNAATRIFQFFPHKLVNLDAKVFTALRWRALLVSIDLASERLEKGWLSGSAIGLRGTLLSTLVFYTLLLTKGYVSEWKKILGSVSCRRGGSDYWSCSSMVSHEHYRWNAGKVETIRRNG